MNHQNMRLEELTKRKYELCKQIQNNPASSGMDQVELDEVRVWIELRMREQERPSSEHYRFRVGA